jgi:hypothetical protein
MLARLSREMNAAGPGGVVTAVTCRHGEEVALVRIVLQMPTPFLGGSTVPVYETSGQATPVGGCDLVRDS